MGYVVLQASVRVGQDPMIRVIGHLWGMMRTRSVLVLGALLLCAAGVAQEEDGHLETPEMFKKGRFFLAVDASWKSEDYELKDIDHWNLEPQVGYFFIDKLSAGLGGVIGMKEFDYVKTSNPDAPATYKYSERGWSALGPFVRGHMGGPRIAAFAQVGAYFGGIDETSENNYSSPTVISYEQRKGAFQLYDFGAGIAWYFKSTIGIEAMAHYYLGYAQTDRYVYTSSGTTTDYPRERNSADGGGGSLGLVYMFGLAKGASKPAGN